HLLGVHVADRAQDLPRRRAIEGCVIADRLQRAPVGLRADELGQSEVENLHPPVAQYEDVLRLQIAVNDSLLVSGGQAAGDLDRMLDRLSLAQRGLADLVAERPAL